MNVHRETASAGVVEEGRSAAVAAAPVSMAGGLSGTVSPSVLERELQRRRRTKGASVFLGRVPYGLLVDSSVSWTGWAEPGY